MQQTALLTSICCKAHTLTLFFCPMRWARACACRSICVCLQPTAQHQLAGCRPLLYGNMNDRKLLCSNHI